MQKFKPEGPPLVTVGVLCYNTGRFVLEALKSIYSSGYSNLEVICIDDASTDDSSTLLEEISKEMGFRFLSNESNIGVVRTANKVLYESNGEFLLFVSDDVILANRISPDVEILRKNPEAVYVCSEVELIDSDSRPFGKPREIRDMCEGLFREELRELWLNGSSVYAPTVTYRTSALKELGGWDEDFEIEDRPLWHRLSKLGLPGWRRLEVTTLYRRHDRNFGSKFRLNALKEERLLVKKYGVPVSQITVVKKLLGQAHFHVLAGLCSPKEAKESLRFAGLWFLTWTFNSKFFKRWYYSRTRALHDHLKPGAPERYLR